MFSWIAKRLAEQHGYEYEKVKWLVVVTAVVIFGSIYTGENVYLSGNVGFVYGAFVAFNGLAAAVLLHYSGHRNKELAKRLAQWETLIGAIMIASCVALLVVIRHHNVLLAAESEYAAQIERYNQKKIELKKEETRQKELRLEEERIGLDRDKEATAQMKAQASTVANLRRVAQTSEGKKLAPFLNKKIQEVATVQSARIAEDGDSAPDTTLEKPEKPPSSREFLTTAELCIGIFSGLETLLAWLAIGTSLRQGTIKANEEHQQKVEALKAKTQKPQEPLIERVGAISNIEEKSEVEQKRPLPYSPVSVPMRGFSLVGTNGKDRERSGKIGNVPAAAEKEVEKSGKKVGRQENPAPEIGPGFFIVEDGRRKVKTFNVSRRTSEFRKGLLICRLSAEDLAEMDGANRDRWNSFLIDRVEAAKPENREAILRALRAAIAA